MAEQPTIYELIAAVMGDVQAVGKHDRNNEQGYTFRGVDAVVNAVGPVLRKHGVVPVPQLRQATYRDVQTSRGKPSRECTLQVTYRFYGPRGDYVDVTVPGESMDIGDKGTAKAMSVAYRIALLQLLCIPTDEPDPDSQAYERENHPVASTDHFDWLAKRIAGAESLDGLRLVWSDVVNAVREGSITAEHGNALREAYAQRGKELEVQ